MWLQFFRRTHCKNPFISYPKSSYKVQLMRMIKNRKIFLVQIATRLFPKHIYRSLRALLNSTLTRNEFGCFQTQTIHKIEGSKPCIYTFYTKTRQFPTQFVTSIPMIFFFLSFFLLFFSLLFSLIRFCSLFLQDIYFSLIPFLFHFFSLLEHS